ncbi:MAG: response regulator [Acidobacteriota bacterium]|nr:response regulator [Acidobacteriota bacterium]
MTADATRILIVDDNPHDRVLLQEHLSREGYEIDTAEDGVEGFHLMERDPWRYDVVLLDRNMPRLGGVELLQWLKANSELRSLPVILQTASDSRADLLAAMKGGAFYFLTKPYDVEVLLTVVATAVRDRASYRQLQTVARRSELATGLLRSATFRLRTIEEARDVGTLVAGLCPDPGNTVIGLTELIVNAVEHGNLGITYAEKSELNGINRWLEELDRRAAMPQNAEKYVDVAYERDEREIRITVRDQGAGFDWRPYLEPDPTRVFDTHGRGITIARRLSFDDLEYRDPGNEVVAKIDLS